ncbi:hypothetical protein GGF46_005373 [Coemansia sp. RSA 552]|nr:hypothetical protein GGF46_005373 [Coemansia sp. RSA 552]
MHIQGSVAVITGGARGFGQRLAEVLAERGGRVVIGDVLETEGELVAASLNRHYSSKVAVFQRCDVTQLSSIQALVERAIGEFGGLDIMVNNAGIGGTLPWIEDNGEALSKTIAINLRAPIEGTRLAVRHFRKSWKPGCIVNVSSMMAFFPMEVAPVYGATKAALVNFTASCATLAQLCPPVRVNTVAPSFSNTALVDDPALQATSISQLMNLLTVDEVVEQMIRCIEDESLAGDTIRMLRGKPPLVNPGRKAVDLGALTRAKL